jgi:hypothetical protein
VASWSKEETCRKINELQSWKRLSLGGKNSAVRFAVVVAHLKVE